MLNIDEVQRIQELLEQLHKWQFSDLNISYVLCDLKSLKLEILNELGIFAFVFPLYLSLLIRECYKFTPEELYLAGRNYGTDKKGELDGFFEYVSQRHKQHDIVTLYAQMHSVYGFLMNVLQLQYHQTLLEEFTLEFRELYGCLEQNAQLFFLLGYDYSRKNKLQN